MSVTLLQKGKIVIPPNASDYEKSRISELPAIDYVMSWFTRRMPSKRGGKASIDSRGIQDRVLIVKAGTGSGKSTTLAPKLYSMFSDNDNRSIAVTQPRVLTAIDIPNKIAKIPTMSFLKFGKNLGYQTGLFINKPIRGIIFMTIGVISHQIVSMENDMFLQKYSFIVLDECHERSIDLDVAMYKLKRFISRNYKNSLCPFLVLTSATFDTMKYAKYFDCGMDNIIEVMGQTKPIAEHFTVTKCSNMIWEAMNMIVTIHEDNEHDLTPGVDGDIIVFVSKTKLTDDLTELIEAYNTKLYNNKSDKFIVPITLTSASYKDQGTHYKNIYQPLSNIDITIDGVVVHPVRRVIIATPVAETGVTIDSLKYCIDSGFALSPEWNPVYGATVVMVKPVTQNMAMQRRGRVGRGFPGEWYPLFSKDIFNKLIPNTLPDIIRGEVDYLVLSIIIEQALPDWDGSIMTDLSVAKSFDSTKIDLLDPVPYDGLAYSLKKFYAIGLIDHEYKPTIKALCAVKFSHVSIESICMILNGFANGANIMDLVTIAAFMSAQVPPFMRKYKRRTVIDTDAKRAAFKTRFFIGCDMIDYLLLYNELLVVIKSAKGDPYVALEKWCEENSVDKNAVMDILTIRDGILSSLVHMGLTPQPSKIPLSELLVSDFESGFIRVQKIKECIYKSWRMNTATWCDTRKKYISDANYQPLEIKSDLITGTQPTKIIYNKITIRSVMGGPFKFYAETISVLDGFVVWDDDYLVS